MPIEISNRARVESFTTLDGSTIRELAGRASTATADQPDRGRRPRSAASNHQSLAEAIVPAGGETLEHLHHASEEIYYFIAGHGRMRLGDDEHDVNAGDCVVIAPGTRHKLWAAADGDLVLLCACAPPYRDDDTQLTAGREAEGLVGPARGINHLEAPA
jgi:mannose-6-phosphate isomerase-like protein (cupin superfamily)